MGKIGSEITASHISSIYNNYNPAYKNLYTVEIFPRTSTSEDDEMSEYIKFHTTSVTFNGESISLMRNSITKNFQLANENPYSWSDSLSITWRESDDWKVKKYHEKWLSCFYLKDKDCFLSYPIKESEKNSVNNLSVDDLYRKIRITLPVSSVGTESNKYTDNTIVLEDVLPSNNGDFGFSWNTNGEIITHTINYFVKNWHWENTNAIYLEEKRKEIIEDLKKFRRGHYGKGGPTFDYDSLN